MQNTEIYPPNCWVEGQPPPCRPSPAPPTTVGRGGCKALSGTSVASPVVAGATALLVALAKRHGRPHNAAMLKQVLATARASGPAAAPPPPDGAIFF